MLPALELIDSRIRDWRIGLLDTIADNASSAGVILGSSPVPLAGADLRLACGNLHKNGELAGTGAGGAVLGSPLTAVVWLANTLGERGVVLEPGQVILPGSATAAIPVGPGDTVTATFAGLGSVTARFASAGGKGAAAGEPGGEPMSKATAAIVGRATSAPTVYSSFLLHAQRAAERYGVPAHAILQRAGEAGYVGGQEDMIIDIALTLQQERETAAGVSHE